MAYTRRQAAIAAGAIIPAIPKSKSGVQKVRTKAKATKKASRSQQPQLDNHLPPQLEAPAPATAPAKSRANAGTYQHVDLFKLNPQMWLENQALEQRIRNHDLAKLRKFEGGRKPDFHLFRKLALELRTMVWNVAASEPRVVEGVREMHHGNVPALESRTLVPYLLHVNKESREIGLKMYERVAPSKKKTDPKFREPFVNWERDTIFYNMPRFFLPAKAGLVYSEIRHLAIRKEHGYD